MKPDWIIHYILCERPSSHTHGLDRHGSLELELNLPVIQEKAKMILNLMGLEIAEKGKCYRSGDREDNVFTIPIYLFEENTHGSPTARPSMRSSSQTVRSGR